MKTLWKNLTTFQLKQVKHKSKTDQPLFKDLIFSANFAPISVEYIVYYMSCVIMDVFCQNRKSLSLTFKHRLHI